MNWSRIASLETWKGLALEAAWRIGPCPELESQTPTWPLDPEQLETVRVAWPLVYQWEPSRSWVEPLRDGFSKYVKVEFAQIPQPYAGIVLIQLSIRGTIHTVALDYSDYPVINNDCACRCSLYFKMQFPR